MSVQYLRGTNSVSVQCYHHSSPGANTKATSPNGHVLSYTHGNSVSAIVLADRYRGHDRVHESSQTSFGSTASLWSPSATSSSLWNSCCLSSDTSLPNAFADCVTSDSEFDCASSTKLCPKTATATAASKKANCVNTKSRSLFKSFNSALRWVVGRAITAPSCGTGSAK